MWPMYLCPLEMRITYRFLFVLRAYSPTHQCGHFCIKSTPSAPSVFAPTYIMRLPSFREDKSSNLKNQKYTKPEIGTSLKHFGMVTMAQFLMPECSKHPILNSHSSCADSKYENFLHHNDGQPVFLK